MSAEVARQVFERLGHFTLARDASFNMTSHEKNIEFQEFFWAHWIVLQQNYMAMRGLDRTEFDPHAVEWDNFLERSENLIEAVNFNQKGGCLGAYDKFRENALVVNGVKQIKADIRVQIFMHLVHADGRVESILAIMKKFGNLLFSDLTKSGLPQCVLTRAQIFRICSLIYANSPNVTGNQGVGTYTWTPLYPSRSGFICKEEQVKVIGVLACPLSWPLTMVPPFLRCLLTPR